VIRGTSDPTSKLSEIVIRVSKWGSFSNAGKDEGVAVRALVDTGGQRSMLSQTVIDSLNLLSCGEINCLSSMGASTRKKYRVDLAMDGDETVIVSGVEVLGGSVAKYEAILGMDVISQFTFTRHPDGTFSLV